MKLLRGIQNSLSPLVNWLRDGLGLAEAISILAILVASPPMYDLLTRKWTGAVLNIQAPELINFRTESQQNNSKEMESETTVAMVPVTYLNSGNTAQGIAITEERVIFSFGSTTITLNARWTTELTPKTSTWLGDIKPWLPTFLPGGEAKAREVLFVPKKKTCDPLDCIDNTASKLTWKQFRVLIISSKEEWAKVKIVSLDNTGTTHESNICFLNIPDMKKQLVRSTPNTPSYYWIQPNCWPHAD